METLSKYSIREKWGVGFEIISFNGKEFFKENNITYIYFILEYQESIKGHVPKPALIINTKYESEILLITSYDFADVRTYDIYPFDRTETSQRIPRIEFGNNKIVFMYLYKNKRGDWLLARSSFHEAYGAAPIVDIDVNENRQQIAVRFRTPLPVLNSKSGKKIDRMINK